MAPDQELQQRELGLALRLEDGEELKPLGQLGLV